MSVQMKLVYVDVEEPMNYLEIIYAMLHKDEHGYGSGHDTYT